MNTSEVLKIVDHTLLTQTATWEDIKTILDDGIKYEQLLHVSRLHT